MQIDTINKVINVESSNQDAQGKPLLEWNMDAATGKVKQTKRSKDGAQVQVTSKEIDVK